MQRRERFRFARRAGIAVGLLLACAPVWAQSGRHFVVTFAPSAREKPFTGRVLVMLSQQGGAEPRLGPDWFEPQPFFAMDVKDWKPGAPLTVGEKSLGFPASLAKLPTGKYAAQAVMDFAPDTHEIGNAPGNAYSDVVSIQVSAGKPELGRLRIDKIVEPQVFEETEQVKLVDVPSPLLSKFYGRPIRMQAGVALPADYAKNPEKRYPVVYIIPGFGGDHFWAHQLDRIPVGPGNIPAIRVVSNPDAATGHHVFADSATNGPRGEALIKELIPAIEQKFRAVGKPSARFLNGHSSGGWSSLWLQVTYPDFFGGTWSTSPDPVDFRDFQQINLYAEGENMFTDRKGQRRPLARMASQPVLYYKPFCDMETVLGRGGQLMSFEAVFSPRGENGKPKQLWNRQTGAIDPAVAKAWEKYDISLILEQNWTTLRDKLRGKLHVITGELDTFYLNGAVSLLKERLQRLGSDAVIEIQAGKDHGTLLSEELQARIGREMMAAYQRENQDK